MTGLRIEKVWKEYGDQIVLENITLEIAPRSFLALVGPSGCGKRSNCATARRLPRTLPSGRRGWRVR